jgi:hypothetical protein
MTLEQALVALAAAEARAAAAEEELARLRPRPSRAERIRARDEAIRAVAARHYAGQPRTVVSQRLARDLRLMRPGREPLSDRRGDLMRIVELSGGRRLSARRIFDIL